SPRGFVIFGSPQSIVLGPFPNATLTYVLTGVQWLPQLVADTDSDWYTINAPDARLYLSSVEGATWLQDDALAQFYQKYADSKVKQILRSVREQESSEEGPRAALYGSRMFESRPLFCKLPSSAVHDVFNGFFTNSISFRDGADFSDTSMETANLFDLTQCQFGVPMVRAFGVWQIPTVVSIGSGFYCPLPPFLPPCVALIVGVSTEE